jgi:hypothetical protein
MTGSRLDTNFNIEPYFDDFNEADAKNYYRILFKPAVAVQTREIIQIQSILQEQIAKFGSYVFKDGSIVDRCAINYIPNFPVIYVENEFNSNNDLSILDVPADALLVSNSGVRAAVSTTRSGFELTYPETNRFYVSYISTGTDGSGNDVAEFQSGETIFVYNGNQNKFGSLVANNLIDSINIITSNGTANATGTAYGVSVSDGIVFQKGFFITVNAHTIPVRDHDTSVNNYVVGFNTAENIIDYTQDETLLSNAAGFFNVNAPGADRLQLLATLVAKPKSETANSTNFFAIVEFDSDAPTQTNTDESSLNQIRDILAQRTMEESGNYTVKPFTIDTTTHSANNQQFEYNISAGIMYVNGYRIEKLNSFSLVADRANTLREATSQIATANYGNYVLVNEHLGVFDSDHDGSVNLYDTAQHTVSTYTNSNAAATGNIVGKANVLNVQYDSGVKGTPTTQYRVYLFNIQMNSGKSFTNDVKSIVGTAFAGAKADVVLDASGLATLNDSASQTLVFPLGQNAVDTLRNASGGNETSFVFRDIASATMAANGVVTFTINTPANGGNERLNASVGTLSNSLATNFNISTSAAAYSANIAGTISFANTSNTITGTGTTFNTLFNVGDMIRVNTTGAAFVIRRIAAIANSTQLTIDTPILAAANAAAKVQKYYPAGHVVELADFGGTIQVLSNTQFTVATKLDVGLGTVDSGTQTLYAEYPVLRSNAVAIKKTINRHKFVKIDCSNNVATSVGPWDLGFIDVAKIRNVYIGTTYDINNPERSSWFTYDNGQKDNVYGHGKLIVKPSNKASITSSTKMLIELDYFVANTATGVGFFSVDSYPIDDANTANATAIQTAEIPQYFSTNYNQFIDLRNAVDFRPQLFNTANSANATAATINPPVANNSINNPASGQYLIDADSNFITDLQYYLPRKDLIVINSAGDISSRVGQPNELPVFPTNEIDTAVIAQVTIPPFPSLTTPEASSFGRNDLQIGIDVVTNRVYTEADIGTIDARVTRLEYYAALNLLEQQAVSTSITDSNGLDRFKNGIFAEPFSNFNNSKTTDIEYSIAIDEDNGIARPKFNQHNIDYTYRADLSSGVAKTGNFITAPYTHELFVDQRFGTGTRNATGASWKWNGKVSLYPSYDYATDTIDSGQSINVTQDLTTNAQTGTTYGDWRTVSSSTTTNTSSTSTTTTSQQVITTTTAQTVANTISTGKYVVGVTDNAYIRSREVAFMATGMKPNTTMHVFFDNTLVDQYCAPGTPSGINNVESGSEQLVVTRTGVYGTTIKSDANGNVYGMFKIPASTFLNGEREFVIVDVTDLINQAGSILTEASAQYTASSITVETGTTTLTTLTTEINTSVSTATRSSTTTTQNSNWASSYEHGGHGGGNDPIAQSFTATVPSTSSGMFLTKVGLFFESKDAALGCSVFIIQTTLGIPDSTKIFGKAYLKPSDISVSADGSVETQFTFVNPVYLENGTEYAFMVKPDGNSPEYNLYIAETGNYDIITGEQVYSNPYSGVLFVSSNAITWTANQTEDLKFRLYRANFTVGTGTAVFNNSDDDFLSISGLVKSGAGLDVDVGDYIIKTVGGTRISNTANTLYVSGTVKEIDEANDYIRIGSSNGKILNNDTIEFHRSANSNSIAFNANTLIATTNVASVDDMSFNAIVPRFGAITPAMTSLVYAHKGTDETYDIDASFVNLTPEIETELFDYARIVGSKSNETLHNSGAKTSTFNISVTTQNIYISPVIDLRRKAALMIENVINDDSTNEYTRYGNATTKYISKNIVLDDSVGDAEDAVAYLGAYRPAGTDIQVYIKVLGSDDGESFDSKLWTQMVMDSGSSKLFSATANTADYHDFTFNMPTSITASVGSETTAYLNANGIMQYARTDGALISRYKTFCFKIVLLSDDTSKVPRLTDFRSIALMS